MRDISAPRSTWEGFLMDGQLEADFSSLVADWSLFNGTPVSLIKRKMNHRYSGPEELRAQNLIVIGCVAALWGRGCACVYMRVCKSTSVVMVVSPSHTPMHMAAFPLLVMCVHLYSSIYIICIDLLNVHFSHSVRVRQPSCVWLRRHQSSLIVTDIWCLIPIKAHFN